MNRSLVGARPQAAAYVERALHSDSGAVRMGKNNVTLISGRGGGAVRDVMLGSRFSTAEKPCASAHTGV